MELEIKPISLPSDNERPFVIAGPCSAETEEQVMTTAKQLASKGCHNFRAGVWKPRTKPGGFEGHGEKALPWLQRVKKETGMLVATEVATPEHVELALKKKISDMYMKAGLEMIRTDEIMAMGTGDKRSQKGILTAILGDLEREGTITKVNPSYYISVQAWDNAVETAKSFDGEFTLAEYRDRLGTSRKYAAELLPAFDKAGITIFNGTSRTMVKR